MWHWVGSSHLKLLYLFCSSWIHDDPVGSALEASAFSLRSFLLHTHACLAGLAHSACQTVSISGIHVCSLSSLTSRSLVLGSCRPPGLCSCSEPRLCKPWNASSLHMVNKDDGKLASRGDFRRLNNATTPDRAPVLHILDFAIQLAWATIFSKVDLVHRYHKVPYTRRICPRQWSSHPSSLFELVRMPFGLKRAGQPFQCLMNAVLCEIPFLFVYLNDNLVARADPVDHQTDL